MPFASPGRVVEIDLSPFSIGRRAALHPVVVVIGTFAWFMVLVLAGTSGAAWEAVLAGVATMAVFFIGFVATIIQRMSRSTTGRTAAFIASDGCRQAAAASRPAAR